MKNFLKQPVVHFLFVGLVFFVLYDTVSGESSDSRTIVVDDRALMNYLQYRAKGFNQEVFEKKMAEMTPEELDQVIQSYVREEVLYREAQAMGLDKEDNIIKRRMIQKVEFISLGIAEASANMTDDEIETFYREHRDDYFIQPVVTFTHVFLSNEKRGLEEAEDLAKKEVDYLNKQRITFDQAPSRGDRFYYHTNYVERDPSYVASHFGKVMADAIFNARASDRQWIGPLQSEYGFHLVMVTRSIPGRYPSLEEIHDLVKEDAERQFIRQNNEATIQEIVDRYEVVVTVDGNH